MTGILAGFLDRQTLAEQLGVSERTLHRYENLPDGLPHVTIGGRRLYRVSAVLDWIAARERKPNRRRAAA